MAIEIADILIRKITEKDNKAIATIIRKTLEEFNANHPGTVYYDASTDFLYQLFQNKNGAVYFIAEANNEVLGGGGIYPTEGLPDGTCELVKMYLLPKARGLGLGKKLIQQCIAFAQQAGCKYIYLETMPELKQALVTYQKLGFQYLDHSLGNTGHHGCNLWMLRSLSTQE